MVLLSHFVITKNNEWLSNDAAADQYSIVMPEQAEKTQKEPSLHEGGKSNTNVLLR